MKTKILIAALTALVITPASIAAPERVQTNVASDNSSTFLDDNLKIGMSPSQVRKILGKPVSSVKRLGDRTTRHYICELPDNTRTGCAVEFDRFDAATSWLTYS